MLRVVYESIQVLPFDRDAARVANALHASAKGRPLPMLDCIIAGHAISAGMKPVTADNKDYSHMPGLDWMNWRPKSK